MPSQPALLILYNNVDVLRGFTDPLQMMSAMYGLHEVVFTTSHSPAAQLLSASRRLGGSRRLTPEHNTTVSAVAVLFEGPEGPYLVVYHNGLPQIRFLPGSYGARASSSGAFGT